MGGRNTADDDQFLRVHLLKPVAKGSEARIRIYKTYTDAASYYEKDGTLHLGAAPGHQAQRGDSAAGV